MEHPDGCFWTVTSTSWIYRVQNQTPFQCPTNDINKNTNLPNTNANTPKNIPKLGMQWYYQLHGIAGTKCLDVYHQPIPLSLFYETADSQRVLNLSILVSLCQEVRSEKRWQTLPGYYIYTQTALLFALNHYISNRNHSFQIHFNETLKKNMTALIIVN